MDPLPLASARFQRPVPPAFRRDGPLPTAGTRQEAATVGLADQFEVGVLVW